MRPIKQVSWMKKVALPRVGGKALLTFMFCLIFSVALWMLQVFREVNSVSLSVEMEYDKMPDDLILLDSLPSRIEFQLKDKGYNLISYLLWECSEPMRLDCLPYFLSNGVFQVSSSNLEQQLRTKFPTGEISLTKPQSIHSYYTKGASKRVPIRLRLNASFAKQKMQSGSVLISPNVVTVYASSDRLGEIADVVTDSIVLEGLSDSTTFVAQLPRLSGVRFVPDRVQITVPVEAYVEKHFKVKVESMDVPSEYVLKTFPQEVSLVCFLPMSRYKDIRKEQFHVGVYYPSDGVPTVLPVSVIRQPDAASVVRLLPETVEILLEKGR